MRLIGIDTPEVFGGLECGGRSASASMKRFAPKGRRVRVFGDPTQARRDSFGRLLAYVKTRGGPQLNIAQIRRGWAKVFVFGGKPFRQTASFRRAARSAKRSGRGVWGRCGGNFHRRLQGSTAGPRRRSCGRIIYTPRSDDSVSNIAARGLTCTKARRALRRYRYLNSGGWRCVGVPGTEQGLEGSGRYHCRKHGRLIAYDYP